MLTVQAMDALQSNPGDFGALVSLDKGIVYLPKNVFDAAKAGSRAGVYDGLEVISNAMAFPSHVAAQLGWAPRAKCVLYASEESLWSP